MAQNEWLCDNNERYYMIPKTGRMATGWTEIDGDIYYMNSNGTIYHGLVYDEEKDGWYYLDDNGILKIGTITLEDIGLTVETDKDGKIASDVEYLNKINRTVGWYEERKGKVTYSMAKRNGPDSYDCSSSLYNALWNGDFKTRITYAGTTENLFKEKGYLFKEIDNRNIRRGDVFIAGYEGYSLGAGGHTGIVFNDHSISHCTEDLDRPEKLNGIHLTPIEGYTGKPVRWFRIVNQ